MLDGRVLVPMPHRRLDGRHGYRSGGPAAEWPSGWKVSSRRCQPPLLALLSEDPRLPVSALARRVGMSAPAVRERLARLEDSGVIRGYRIDIDPAAVGLPVAAWVRVRPGPGQLAGVAELARQRPEVSECHRISGRTASCCWCHVSEIAALEGVLDDFLRYGQTVSSFVVADAGAAAPGAASR
jgi:Lrp/AsnC family leucine-responsive transcriptional regulator